MLIKLNEFLINLKKNYTQLFLIVFIVFILNLLLKSNIALDLIQLLDDCGFIILYIAFMLIIAYPSYYKKIFVLKLYWLLITLWVFFLSILKINYIQPTNYTLEPVSNLIKHIDVFFSLNINNITLTFLWAEQYFFFKVSSYFVVLTTFIFCICAYNNIKRIRYSRLFILLFLLLEVFLIKAFTTLNLLEFYIYFEGVLIPMYALLLLWGSSTRKINAGYYLLFYTIIFSLPFLLVIIYIGLSTGTYNILEISRINWPLKIELILWFGMFWGFAVKIPMFPIHLWLPEAHVEAPTDGSVILASLLLKLGGYGFIQLLLPIFPRSSIFFSPFVYMLALLGVIYGSLTAIRQLDLKKAVAYSSVAHMNLVILGIFSYKSQGLIGAIFFMLAHGIVAGALFFLIGMLYDRHHNRYIYYFGGLSQVMPLFSFFFFLFSLANLSLPGTCNFVGELLIFLGIFQSNTIVSVFAGTGIVFSAVYSLWLYNRICFGSLNKIYIQGHLDLNKQELIILTSLGTLTILLGIFPDIVLKHFWFIKYWFI